LNKIKIIQMKKVFLCLAVAFLPTSILFAEKVEQDSSNVHILQEVEIVSTRATEKTPVAYSNMSKQEIDAFNFGQDIPLLLTLSPSVIATSDAGSGIGYTGFRIRGTDANRINITTNGIPLNDSESHGVFWVNMPDFASSLQDLQIQRGVGTSTNGAGAFGASINMKTETIPLKAYGELAGSYGSFNTTKATFKTGSGIIQNHWALDVRLSSITSDGFIDRATTDLKSYFAQGAYFNENTLLKLITFGGNEKTYHAWDGVPGDILPENRRYNPCGYMGDDSNGKPFYYEDQNDVYQQTHYQLSLLQKLNPDLNLNLALHYTKGGGYYEEYKSERKLVEYGLTPFVNNAGETVKKSDLVRQKWLDNDFYGGIFSFDYTKNSWNVSLGGGVNQYEGDHFGYVKWVKGYAGDKAFSPNHEYYRSTGKKTDANIYLKGNYQFTSQLNFYGDLQYRFIDYNIQGKNSSWDDRIGDMQHLDVQEKFNFFNPKVGLFYRIDKANNLYASLAVANREPNRNNYVDAAENEISKSEHLLDYELGYKLTGTNFSAGVNFYYMEYKDQLVLTGKVNEIGEALTSNIPDSYRAGVEIVLGAKIAPWLKWNGNLTLSDNKIKNFTEYVEDWETGAFEPEFLGTTPIAYSPDITVGSLFSANYQSWSAGLQSNYVGKQYLDNTGSEDRKIDPYFVSNLHLGYTFRLKGMKSLGINLLVNNIFNEKYETSGYVWYTWLEGSGSNRVRNNDLRYFPQAGTNVLVSATMSF
jgi:iron complex outermembrane receptor protein